MLRFWRHIKRLWVVYLFVMMEAVAVWRYAHSTEYTREKMVAWASALSGWIDGRAVEVGDYFRLRTTNETFAARIIELENQLAQSQSRPHSYTYASLVSNSIAGEHNYFVVERTPGQEIAKDMAVLTIEGSVAGYVERVTDRYVVCMSIANTDFKVGGQVRGKEFFGQVVWTGGDVRYAQLIDIPRYADIVVGDTVQTVYSARFPTGVFIGIVDQAEQSDNGMKINIRIRLGADLARLSRVVLVANPEAELFENIVDR